MNIDRFIIILTACSFLFYGMNCLLSVRMVREFQRYGLASKRKLTAILQLSGAVGLSSGLWLPIIGLSAAAGLSALMLLGFGVRVKIKDSLLESFPSFFFMVLNIYLAYYYYRIIH